jgi:hypothetical protein
MCLKFTKGKDHELLQIVGSNYIEFAGVTNSW